jgi:hypothetical protein
MTPDVTPVADLAAGTLRPTRGEPCRTGPIPWLSGEGWTAKDLADESIGLPTNALEDLT